MEPIIRFQNVSKRFEFITEKPQSVLESLVSRLPRGHRVPPYQPRNLWAVRNVTLDILPGQCLGILGRNGSGKSTLMKLIARILRPTEGRVMVRGRVSALLELGAGFHPDLTGRENIYLNASVLGLQKQEIEAHFDSIVAFSELEDFIDTPVKHYSSGMYMRLGFSVAVHVNPDTLMIDEILAVGDQSFQEKCINHIYHLKSRGVTIVLVSHNLDMMRKLCTHMVWMEGGHIRTVGTTESVIQQYLGFLHEQGHEAGQAASRGVVGFERMGTGEVEITAVHFRDHTGQKRHHFHTGDALTIELAYLAHKPILYPEFGLAFYRQDGILISGPNTQFAGLEIEKLEGEGLVRYHIQRLPLLPADYLVTVAVQNSRYTLTYDHHEKAYLLHVSSGHVREIFGLVEFPATWEWQPTTRSS